MFLGQLAHLASKDNGDKSMPVTQHKPDDVYGHGLQDPQDRVKARLLEAQSPAGESDAPIGTTSEADVISCIGMNRETIQPPRDERFPARVLKEMSGPPTFHSEGRGPWRHGPLTRWLPALSTGTALPRDHASYRPARHRLERAPRHASLSGGAYIRLVALQP